MSESETIVTAPATKEKNPKRVAQGKISGDIKDREGQEKTNDGGGRKKGE